MVCATPAHPRRLPMSNNRTFLDGSILAGVGKSKLPRRTQRREVSQTTGHRPPPRSRPQTVYYYGGHGANKSDERRRSLPEYLASRNKSNWRRLAKRG